MQLKAHEYCALIGFTEGKALINKKLAKNYKGYDVQRFVKEGMLKQAFSLAYYREDEAAMQEVLATYTSKLEAQGAPLPGRSLPSQPHDLVRLFGCLPPHKHCHGVLYV